MSETMALPPFIDASARKTPTVYFIDDSATMREVIKIAFRRENFNVITCGDAASALSQFDQNPPDAVITDVIMPDQDGYSVCTQIKQHEKFAHIPVILMSGVVNKAVADKAVGVKADELIRKPFQPQELIGRVKALLNPKSASTPAAPASAERPSLPGLQQHLPAPGQAPTSLSSLFAPPPPISAPPQPHAAQPISPNAAIQPPPENAWPRALADAFTPPPVFVNPAAQRFQPNQAPPFAPPQPHQPAYPQQPAQPIHAGFANPNQQPGHPQLVPPTPQPRPVSADLTKLRAEIARLELQVKKLQTEVQIERQYNTALEAQLHAYTHSD
jgi:CheY-like chemotaxis protein